MIIHFWGARGSIPVSGPEYLRYGGETTCLEIQSEENEIIIVDAGTGIRKLGNKLLAEKRNRLNMIFTHAHWDHIQGLPFFKPIYRRATKMRMFGCPSAQDSLEDMVSRVMAAPNFPVSFSEIQAQISWEKSCDEGFQIDSLTVTPIPLSHPNEGRGYRFSEGDKSFAFLTDNELAYKHAGGLAFSDYAKFVHGTDLLIHDAEYTRKEYLGKKTWGHSRYLDAVKLALKAGVKRLGLFHHNQDRTDDEVDEIVDECRRLIKKEKSELDCFAVAEGMEVHF
jgi:phosphoribosyl 1,2-cyclic phosphodiesterase